MSASATTAGRREPLETMSRIAQCLARELAPACTHEPLIVGSIRRKKANPGDVEIVAIPRLRPADVGQVPLFGPPDLVLEVWEVIEAMGRDRVQPILPGAPSAHQARKGKCPYPEDKGWPEKRLVTAEEQSKTPGLLPPGRRYFRLWLPKASVRVDLFLATVETWGLTVAIRTGPADFSRALVERWTALTNGGHCHESRLHYPYTGRAGGAVSTSKFLGPVEPTRTEAEVFKALKLPWIDPEDRTVEALSRLRKAA